jgi:cell division protein FtsQ
MHQQISKKIFIYLLIYFILVTINNTNLSNLSYPKINDFEIHGLSQIENEVLLNDLKEFEDKNIFSINKDEISKKIDSNKIIERYFIFKNYPSKLKIEIEKTNFIAITKKKNQKYYVASNGNLIRTENLLTDLPFVYGDIDVQEFLIFKKIVDNSIFDFDKIKNLFYFESNRWDLEINDGLIIKLPRKKIQHSLDLVSKLLTNKNFENVKLIDLRQNNQIIVDG